MINHRMYRVLSFLLCMCTHVATAHYNKTFMQQRNHALNNLPMDYVTLKEREVARLEDRFGGILSAKSFIMNDVYSGAHTTYFSMHDKPSVIISQDLLFSDIIHGLAVPAESCIIKLIPKMESYGFILGYHQDLSKVLPGLYLAIKLPIIHMESAIYPFISSNKDIASFFQGEVIVGSNQEPLRFGKIYPGLEDKKQSNGVADIDITVGYRFLQKDEYNAGFSFALVLPTHEQEHSCAYLLEPMVGSNHWGIGGGLDAQALIWGDEDHYLKISHATTYRYFFQAPEKRLLGLSDIPWGHYQTIITSNGNLAPAANYLVKNVEVAKGSLIEMVLGLAYAYNGFTVDLGYNLYFAERETIKMHHPIPQYILAKDNSTHDIDATAAETPLQFTNSIYAGMGYTLSDFENPLSIGMGLKLEFASQNSALDNAQVWITLGWSF